MQTLQSVLNLITPDRYLVVNNLKYVNYLMPKNYFIWKEKLSKFLDLPNSLCNGPIKFTKLMKSLVPHF